MVYEELVVNLNNSSNQNWASVGVFQIFALTLSSRSEFSKPMSVAKCIVKSK